MATTTEGTALVYGTFGSGFRTVEFSREFGPVDGAEAFLMCLCVVFRANRKERLPDITTWTSDDVREIFAEYGAIEEHRPDVLISARGYAARYFQPQPF